MAPRQSLAAGFCRKTGANQKDGTPLPEGTKLADQFQLNAFPTLVILDAQGKELRRQVGLFRTGTEFAAWLNAK